jgi:chromosome segregation ATPase
MNTEDLIKQLRSALPLGPTMNELLKFAADRLEELQRANTNTLAEREHWFKKAKKENEQWLKALAELERTRQRLLHDLRVSKEERDEFLGAKIQGINRVDELEQNLRTEKSRADANHENYCEMLQRINAVVKERDEARAEVERLKQALHDSRIENSGQAAQFERTRPEPSRLEIAAMLVAAMCGSQYTWTNAEGLALRKADTLIALAKEAQA